MKRFWVRSTLLLLLAVSMSLLLRETPLWLLSSAKRALRSDPLLAEPPRALSTAARRFGEDQLDALLRARPAMANRVQRGDLVYQWVVVQLAGRDESTRIYLSSEAPTTRYQAENQYPWDSRPGIIRIAYESPDGRRLKADELWSLLIFELFNIKNGPLWGRLSSLARGGRISRAAYIERSAALEYYALERTWKFFDAVWVPFVNSKGHPVDVAAWGSCHVPPTFKEWKATWKTGAYPYDIFGPYFDQLTKRNDP